MTENIPGRKTVEAVLMPEGGTVTWVNEDVSELKTRVGDVSHMPFVYPPFFNVLEMTARVPETERLVLDIDGQHRRHSALGIISIDSIEYQILLKGTGLLSTDADPLPWTVDPYGLNYRDPEIYLRGLCGEHEALVDARIAQFINKLGGFCAIPLTIAAYHKIPYQRDENGGLKYATVSELQYMRHIPSYATVDKDGQKTFNKNEHIEKLVAYARAFRTNVRIDEKRNDLVEKEIFRLVQPLTQIGEITLESLQGFIEYVASRMGATLGILHACNLCNPEMGARNVTLMGELTDLSACALFSENISITKEREVRGALEVLKTLCHLFEGVFYATDPSINSSLNMRDAEEYAFFDAYRRAYARTKISPEEIEALFE